MNSLKNNPFSTDFSLWVWHRLKSVLQLSLFLLLPLVSGAQTLRTKGNIKIRASGCVKIYVNGSAKFDSATILKGSADFQVRGCLENLTSNFFTSCTPTVSKIWLPCMTLFPNPAEDILNIQYLGGDLGDRNRSVYQIFDMQGRQMLTDEKNTADQTWQINVSHLPQGAYILKFGNCAKKFLKQ